MPQSNCATFKTKRVVRALCAWPLSHTPCRECMFDLNLLLLPLLLFVLASISSSIVGSFVVVKRLSMMAASISHSILGGMGLFLYLNKTLNMPILSPTLGAFIASIFFAWIMGLIHLKLKNRQDVVLSCVWILGMSLGVLFLAKTPGYNVELVHFLFGNVLFATWTDALMMVLLDLFLLASFFIFYRKFNLYFFDETQAKLQKMNITFWTLFLFILIGTTTFMLIQVVGILLVLALLTIPAHLSSLFSKSLMQMSLFAFCFAIGFCFLGTLFATLLNLPIGATVAFISAIIYLVVIVV